MGKRVTVPISIARKELFHLTDLVRTSSDETVVVLEQRGSVEPVALVREARLAYLEARVNEIDAREAKRFTLAGTLATDLDEAGVEASLRQLRSEWTPRVSKNAPAGPVSTAARRKR